MIGEDFAPKQCKPLTCGTKFAFCKNIKPVFPISYRFRNPKVPYKWRYI
jgi:hypothetical protein